MNIACGTSNDGDWYGATEPTMGRFMDYQKQLRHFCDSSMSTCDGFVKSLYYQEKDQS